MFTYEFKTCITKEKELYYREYKRRFAWIKAGRIDAEDFYAWSEEARERKAECETGKISFDEFSEWLGNS